MSVREPPNLTGLKNHTPKSFAACSCMYNTHPSVCSFFDDLILTGTTCLGRLRQVSIICFVLIHVDVACIYLPVLLSIPLRNTTVPGHNNIQKTLRYCRHFARIQHTQRIHSRTARRSRAGIGGRLLRRHRNSELINVAGRVSMRRVPGAKALIDWQRLQTTS